MYDFLQRYKGSNNTIPYMFKNDFIRNNLFFFLFVEFKVSKIAKVGKYYQI